MLSMMQNVSKVMCQPKNVSCCNGKLTIKATKHPNIGKVWGCFSGLLGRAGLYFLAKGEMTNSETYLNVLKDHGEFFFFISQVQLLDIQWYSSP